jgi:hypothetical protein
LVILGSSLIANYTQTCFDKLRQIGIQGMMWETSKSRFSLEPGATLGQNNSKDFEAELHLRQRFHKITHTK